MDFSAALSIVHVSQPYVAIGKMPALKNLSFVLISVIFHNFESCFIFCRAMFCLLLIPFMMFHSSPWLILHMFVTLQIVSSACAIRDLPLFSLFPLGAFISS